MAIKKTIEIDVDVVRANGGLENFTQNFKKSEEAAKSLKTQLRQAQAEVAALSDKFGATSREAVEAAKRAGELKDRIGDAKSLTEAFNPDAKFKSLSASLSGVAGGFAAYQGAMGLVGVESKDLEKQLLKVQSAMAIAQGFQALGEARDSFKQLKAVAIDAFNGIKKAIGSTGIGLLVVALGTVYAYWDDIKEAVNGVSEEQKKLNAESKKNLTQEQEKLKAIGNQDEVLKLQGKSEREILKMKIAQTDQTILAAKVDLKRIETTNEQQQKAVELNYQYLKSFIDFISIPQRLIFENGAKAINKVIDFINKIPGVEIKASIDEKFAEKSADYVTKLGFDPDKTKAEGKKTVDAAKLYLDELANDKAGFQNQINDINKKANEDAAKAAEEAAKIEQDRLEKINDIYDSYLKANQDASAVTEQQKLDLQKQRDLEEINQLAKTETEKANLKALFNEKYFNLQSELDKKLAEDKAKKDEEKIAKEDAEWLRLQELTLEKNDYDALVRQQKFEAEYIAAEGNNELQIALKNDYLKKEVESEKANADAVNKIEEEKAKAREQWMAAGANTLKQAATLLGESTDAGKAAAVAATTIDTYQSATSAYNSLSGIPIVGPVLGGVAAGIAVAAGLANVKKILSVKTPKGGGGGGGVGGGVAPPPPPPQFNIVGQSSTNQLSQTIAGQQNRPIQTYVVGNQISTQQSLDRNAVATSTFG